ncbi:MAG: RNA 2',3'-cyclic phosphodiesterase [Desulfobulbaceae bacterium]|nr:RNA 2',3'-cyclic phosphodiesterase [Desulfobulbaceae bacterium]
MPRLFVAIDLPEQQGRDLSAIYHGLPAGTRWTSPAQLHLTLFFIGEVEASLVLVIKAALAELAFAPFWLRLQGMGCFPHRRQAKIIWVGVEKNPELVLLQHLVAGCLGQLGLAPEERKFHPHLTIARLPPQVSGERVATYLEQNSQTAFAPFAVASFHLYTSTLSRSGAVYHLERSYPAR